MPENSRHVVGYRYQGRVYCRSHVGQALPTGPGEAFDGWAALVPLDSEDNLDEIAIAFGIDREFVDFRDAQHVFPARILDDAEDRAHEVVAQCPACIQGAAAALSSKVIRG